MSIFGMDKTGSFRVIDSFGIKHTIVCTRSVFMLKARIVYLNMDEREKRVLTTGESIRRVGNGIYKIIGRNILVRKLDLNS